MTTLNTSVSIANNAISTYNWIFGDPDKPGIDTIPTIWDVMMSVLVRGVAGSIASGPGGAENGVYGGSGPRDRHHVIPVFCCGHVNGERSLIARSMHSRIHRDLERYALGVNAIGITVDLIVYKRPTSRIVKTPLQRMGMKRIGRAAIAAGLTAFYLQNDYLDKGVPSIGAALLRETPRFVVSHHSAPHCQRGR